MNNDNYQGEVLVKKENIILKKVYLWMTLGLMLTALVAQLVASNRTLSRLIITNSIPIILLACAQLFLVIFLSARIEGMRAGTAIGCFLGYSALTGVTFSTIITAYAGTTTVASAFFTAGAVFFASAIYGSRTKRSLRGWHTYLYMGLIGLIVALLLETLFVAFGKDVSALDLGVSILAVILFTALTAYDSNKILALSKSYEGELAYEDVLKISILGALDLYLDFLNIFLYLVRIFSRGSRK